MSMISFEALARDAYEAYRDSLQLVDGAGRIWGQPAPSWEQLDLDRQQSWVAAVRRVSERLSGLH